MKPKTKETIQIIVTLLVITLVGVGVVAGIVKTAKIEKAHQEQALKKAQAKELQSQKLIEEGYAYKLLLTRIADEKLKSCWQDTTIQCICQAICEE